MLGKGGSGKSTLGGLLCLELRDRGQRVSAIDADTVPGLDQVLGMETHEDWDLAGAAVREHGGWRLEGTPAGIIDRCAREAPSGVRFVQAGNVDASLKDYELRRESFMDRWSGTIAFNTVARQFDDEGGWVVVDLQGGTVQVAGGLAGTKGVALVVVEPFAKSVLTARRFAEMGAWPPGITLAGVANKVSSEDEGAYVEAELERLGVPLWVSVPRDTAVLLAERDGRPLATIDGQSSVKRAVRQLADRLQEEAASRKAVGQAAHS